MSPQSWRRRNAQPTFAKTTLVGESNPYSDDPDDALLPWPDRSAGARLLRLLGWTEFEYLENFCRVNLSDFLPADEARQPRWRIVQARKAANALSASRPEHDLVLLGARVAAAFRADRMPLWTRDGMLHLVRIPHPSGLCRDWDNPAAALSLRRVLEPYRVRRQGLRGAIARVAP